MDKSGWRFRMVCFGAAIEHNHESLHRSNCTNMQEFCGLWNVFALTGLI